MKSTQGHFQGIRVAILLAVAGWSLLAVAPTDARASRPSTAAPSTAQIAEAYGKLPLAFEANHGQTDAQVKFLARGSGYTLFLTGDEAVLSLRQSKSKVDSRKSTVKGQSLPRKRESTTDAVLRMKLVGANAAATVTGTDELPGKSNYFIGNDPKKWRTNVPNYAKVRYQGVYPGVDLVYYGNHSRLEYDFVVGPGADPRAISLRYEGAERARVDKKTGDLVFAIGGGQIRFQKPTAYQLATDHEQRTKEGGARKFVEARYVLKSKGQVGIRLAAYDAAQPLIIDPALVYSSLIGGSGGDQGTAIVVDGSGNAYLTGQTYSTDFPRVNQIPGACQGGCGTNGNGNAFVTKINAAGSALVYSSYLGGSGRGSGFRFGDSGSSIAVDGSGNAYLTGLTYSSDFPRVNQIPDACNACEGGGDAVFVTKINAAGSALVYSSLIGGSNGPDTGEGIALDGLGNTYLTGFAGSTDFPRVNQIPGACNGSCGSGSNVNSFVTEVNAAGNALVYSSVVGGSGGRGGEGPGDYAAGIAVDSSGNAYLTGQTFSPDFPRVNQIPGACNGSCGTGVNANAFVTEVRAAGSALVYSSYLGGSGAGYPSGDSGSSIAVDGSGNAYLTGNTWSTDFPIVNQIPGACNGTCGTGAVANAFVTKINAAGSALVYSSYLGGSGGDEGLGIAVDASGNAYLTGETASTDFPVVNQIPGACNGSCGSGYPGDAFVTEVNAAGSALVYSSYLGGSSGDSGGGIAVDDSGNAYLMGVTGSSDFPRVDQIPGACNGTCGTGAHYVAFVTKITPSGTPIVGLSPTSLNFGPQGFTAPTVPQVVTLTNTGGAPLLITSIAITGQDSSDFAEMDNCPRSPNSLGPADSCKITVVFAPTGAGTRTAAVMITDNAPDSPQNVPLTGIGVGGKPFLAGPGR